MALSPAGRAPHPPFTREVVRALEKSLREHAGLELPQWILEERVGKRIAALGVSAKDYADLLGEARGAGELALLTEAVRVGETRFFRHKKQLDAVARVVVPAFRERGLLRPSIWSAGCATGEEAYTLALVLARAMPEAAPDILATDVSARALELARSAEYATSALEHVPTEYHDGFERGDLARVRPEVARRVRFEQQNLTGPGRPRGCHLIFCRNVLIYFEPEARAKALEKLVHSLAPGGFLFLGYSETLRDVPGLSELEAFGHTVWVKAKKGDARPSPDASPTANPRASSVDLVAKSTSKQAILRPRARDTDALAAELRAALGAPDLTELTLDLDASEFLEDELAPVLRRAMEAASASGIALTLHATRAGVKRWLRRNGLAGGER